MEAALQQGRNEGRQSAGEMSAAGQQAPYLPTAPSFSAQQPVPVQRMPMPVPPSAPYPAPYPAPYSAPSQQRQPEPQRTPSSQREPDVRPNEEVLYNEYGEPVMMRRRVRKTPSSPDGELLYDGNGNPVIRRNQGLWEPLEQRHEIVFKFETAPGMTVSQQGKPENYDRREGNQ